MTTLDISQILANLIICPSRIWVKYLDQYYVGNPFDTHLLKTGILVNGTLRCYDDRGETLMNLFPVGKYNFTLITHRNILYREGFMSINKVKYEFNFKVYDHILRYGALAYAKSNGIVLLLDDEPMFVNIFKETVPFIDSDPIKLEPKVSKTARSAPINNPLLNDQIETVISLVETHQREYLTKLINSKAEWEKISQATNNSFVILKHLYSMKTDKLKYMQAASAINSLVSLIDVGSD